MRDSAVRQAAFPGTSGERYRAALGEALEAAVSNVYLADLAAWVRTGESATGAEPG